MKNVFLFFVMFLAMVIPQFIALADEYDDGLPAIQAYLKEMADAKLAAAMAAYESLPTSSLEADQEAYNQFGIDLYLFTLLCNQEELSPAEWEAVSYCLEEAYAHADRFIAGSNAKSQAVYSVQMAWDFGMITDPDELLVWCDLIASTNWDEDALGFAYGWLGEAAKVLD